ncbi:Pheromone B beta 1 receptor [Schizophyllum commune] [Rhizoctonia solani]|uniref:Pheromone B beta 1 receptor [Schizophyllum commune] n=1 Tax=Rhizoctonia solani TaxID=456999 RepID=A0A0K6G477_9AGAM|nr:Pheromone B beta 1 receptor [Schizophyllum commune] [Rhizoctonia solani]
MRPELTVVSFICTFLMLIPLPWHWRARNIPTLSLIFWLTAVNFPRAISTIIWAGNTMRRYGVISSPDYTWVRTGLLAENARERRRRMIFEIVMCWVLPLIGVVLYYVVQHHRYDIYEDFGCFPAFRPTVVATLIVNVPPVIFALITLVYAAIALRWFIQRRTQFETSLQSNDSGLTISRYLRLVLFSITMMLAGMAMTTFVLINSVVSDEFESWISWDFTHANWNSIDQLARDLVPEAYWSSTLLVWYLVPITSIIFFAFFGCVGELKVEYMGYFDFVKTRVLCIKHKPQPVSPTS